jgi:sugar lactone lactonase YvrE
VTSITLIDAKGDRVRNVIAAQSRPAGKVTESWDGLDNAGRVLPPGEYTWKGLHHEPLKTRYVLAVSNSGSPPYNTPDGKGAWGGDWGCPADVCFAGDRAVLVWDGSEAGMGLIGLDAAGRKQWGQRIGGSCLATDGQWVFVYLAEEKQIRAYAVTDGRQTNFLRGELWAEPNRGKDTACSGLAWQAGKLYVANAAAGEVAEYDARQGKILRRLPVPAPKWIAAAGQDALLVISGGSIQKLGLTDGKVKPLISQHVDEPKAVAVAQGGTIYVSNGGKRHDVTVFDANGKLLRAIGKPGGRAVADLPPDNGHLSPSRAGKWDPDTLLNPRGLAVDAKGRLWVMEHDFSPKRVSVWDTRTGKLLDERFGPCYVSTPACMDPADPTRVYCQNVEWEVDLDKGTWKPAAVMFEARPDTPYFWPHMVNNLVFTAKNGKQYMSGGGSSGGLVRGHFLWVRRGDHFEAVAGAISPWSGLTWRKAPKDWQEYNKVPWLWWEDRNGDGAIQQSETRETKIRAQNSHCVVDADLNFYATGMYNQLYWQRISPKQVLANGVPLYDDASLKHVDYATDHSCYTYDLAVNPADGSLLMYAGSDIKHLARTEIWPINSWSRDGQLQWRYRLGCRWHDMYEFPIPKPGELYGCTRNLGITDGITGFSCYFGQVQLLTTDGVAIGTIMKDGRSGETGPDQIQCEWFTGQLVKLKDGRWFILGGDQDGRVLEVMGLNTIQRFEGKLSIRPEDARAAAAALAEWTALKAKAQSLVLSRCPDKPEWMNLRGVKIDVDQARGFAVKAAYNASELVLRYEVRSPFELVNSTPEQNMLFKGGNLLDIQLATDAKTDPKRDKPAPGDIRVLVTRREGKALAVVYRPKVAGFQGQATVFTSPTGRESIDRIEFWDDIKLQYERTETGFNAVVSLPLARLGLALTPGTVQKMDVGYIFGNQTGNTTATRAYWSNKSFAAGVTQDVPHEARLEPGQWGSATVE